MTIVIMTTATAAKTIQIQYMHLPADFWSAYASTMFYSASSALSFASSTFSLISIKSALYSCILLLIVIAMSRVSTAIFSAASRCSFLS